jgi:L1 cell adhesion molecule like protein
MLTLIYRESERVEIIANEQGNRTTPSYVAFSDSERLVGDAAKNQAAMNPKNTVFDAKRLIGRRFDDPEVKADMKNWPFTVIDKEGNPFVQVDFEGESKTFSPQGIHRSLQFIASHLCLSIEYTDENF